MKIATEKFGEYRNQDVMKYTLTNDNNVSISVLNFAGIWQAYMVPNTRGGRVNLLLAADTFDPYIEHATLILMGSRTVSQLTKATISSTAVPMVLLSSSTRSKLSRMVTSCKPS